MCDYMEQKAQEQIEAGIARYDAIMEEFDRFTEWFLSLPDADETLLSINMLNDSLNLESPSETVNALWVGWCAATRLR